jgi:hypothetical protein
MGNANFDLFIGQNAADVGDNEYAVSRLIFLIMIF